ncbi:MAG: HAMP domain-containing histidine kinase [Pseudomonadales bacterium]|nr:HAMP domain-containing histidine kinase [Pseudomonadales bacterium]
MREDTDEKEPVLEESSDSEEECSEGLDFSSVLASSVHDMKNSIGMLMSSLDELMDQIPEPTDSQNRLMSTVQYEASRVNNDLVHLLSFYRLKKNSLPITLDEQYVAEVLEEQIVYNKVLAEKRGIEVDLKCDDELVWYFDAEMISGIINNVLINAIRYSQNKIQISAKEKVGFLEITVADDGCGFPEAMLDRPGSYFNRVSFSTGSTGLGLYFAGQIATLHKDKERQGFIQLQNGGSLKGGIFRLSLP